MYVEGRAFVLARKISTLARSAFTDRIPSFRWMLFAALRTAKELSAAVFPALLFLIRKLVFPALRDASRGGAPAPPRPLKYPFGA